MLFLDFSKMQKFTFTELIKSAKKAKEHSLKVNVFLLGDSSLQFLKQAIVGYGQFYAINIEIEESEFDSIDLSITEFMNNEDFQSPDLICIIENSYTLWLKFSSLSQEQKISFANDYLDKLQEQISLLQSKTNTQLLISNFIEFDDSVWGSYANKTEQSFLYQLRKINWGLLNLSVKTMSLNVLDMSSIAQQMGLHQLYDYRLFETASMIFSIDSLPLISGRIVDQILTHHGHLKKCIVLDLDNTLWNGVISEDGLSEIGLGDYNQGKSFFALQKWLKLLKNRGVILAVCSKNDVENAEMPFKNHPNSILKLDDFTVFIANWESKVDNIKEIQKRLNIAFSSMIFIDDNPFEREIVKEFIPDITVPQIPDNPEERLPYLMSLNLFETNSFTSEDVERDELYKVEAQRSQNISQFTDTREYLKSLLMVAKIEGLNEFNIPRFSQLSIRSNQFNLRTLRYQPSDLVAIQRDSNRIIYSVSLKDQYGNYGLVSGVVIEIDKFKKSAFIESWFMSCRVLKRGLEQFVMNALMVQLHQMGIVEVFGEIIQNEKNKLIYQFYQDFGFEKLDNQWRLMVHQYQKQSTEIQSDKF